MPYEKLFVLLQMVSDELPSRKNRSVILLLVTENLRNFQTQHKMGMMVRAYSVDCLQHLSCKVFLRTLSQRRGIQHHAFFTLLPLGAEESKKVAPDTIIGITS
jgi:hypothetical protein